MKTSPRSRPSFADFYRGRRVLVTGHTGFKGAWLCEWLLELGAAVTGFALEPDTDPSLFRQLGLQHRMRNHLADLRNPALFAAVLQSAKPDVVFHLGAQPLVRRSYEDPAGTYETNVMGTLHVLDALRAYDRPCSAIIVTSDKCYENTGRTDGYREEDPMGGHDPYSSSKACAEILVSSYRRSFFSREATPDCPVRIASARAGNVIGGGDWAADRIVPDCIRNIVANEPIPVRNRHAVRPWQHVLEPLGGYLLLAAQIHPDRDPKQECRDTFGTFNFGPAPSSQRTVQELVEEVLLHWKGTWIDQTPPDAPHEAAILTLDVSKAERMLNWKPRWSFGAAVTETIFWYRNAQESGPEDIRAMTRDQIHRYMRVLGKSPHAPHLRRRSRPTLPLNPISS